MSAVHVEGNGNHSVFWKQTLYRPECVNLWVLLWTIDRTKYTTFRFLIRYRSRLLGKCILRMNRNIRVEE